MKTQKHFFAISFLILAILACNMPGQGVADATPTTEPTTVVYVVVEPTLTPTIAVTETPSPTATPNLPPEITLLKDSNCRMGPSEFYFYVDQIKKDTVLPVIGRTDDGSWWQVINATDRECWVFSENAQTNQDLSAVPIAEGPALPLTPGNFIVVDTHCDPVNKKFEVAFKWTPNGDETGFKISRNGSKIAELKAGHFNYRDRKVPLKQNFSYSLVAFNRYGESYPAVQIVPECK